MFIGISTDKPLHKVITNSLVVNCYKNITDRASIIVPRLTPNRSPMLINDDINDSKYTISHDIDEDKNSVNNVDH